MYHVDDKPVNLAPRAPWCGRFHGGTGAPHGLERRGQGWHVRWRARQVYWMEQRQHAVLLSRLPYAWFGERVTPKANTLTKPTLTVAKNTGLRGRFAKSGHPDDSGSK